MATPDGDPANEALAVLGRELQRGEAGAVSDEMDDLLTRLVEEHNTAALRGMLRNLSSESTTEAPLVEMAVRDALRRARDAQDLDNYESGRTTLARRMLIALRGGPRRPRQLADELGVDLSQVSRAARRLAAEGAVRITDHGPEDGRGRVYELTKPSPPASRSDRELLASVMRSARLRQGQISNDLIPPRVGDRLPRASLARLAQHASQRIVDGIYDPAEGHIVDVPKPAGGTRPVRVLPLADRMCFAAIVDALGERIEAGLVDRGQVPWPRGVGSPRDWSVVEDSIRRSDAPYIHQMDISNFYGTIPHSVVADELTRLRVPDSLTRSLVSWLGVTMGDVRGLPQGLAASDPLATMCLSPLDRAMNKQGIRFHRYVDDLRMLANSLEEATQQAEFVTRHLREIGLTPNDGKTKTWKRDTYLGQRDAVAVAVRNYLDALSADSHEMSGDHAVHGLLDALDLGEELHWGWYHGNLDVAEVLAALGEGLEPSDGPAVLALLHAVTGQQQEIAAIRDATKEGKLTLRTLGFAALAATEPEVAKADLHSLLAWPEYTEWMSVYLRAIAPKHPEVVSDTLRQMWDNGYGSEAQWSEYFNAVRPAPKTEPLLDLANGQVRSEHSWWLATIEAALYLTDAHRLASDDLDRVTTERPEPLRDESVLLRCTHYPEALDESSLDEFSRHAVRLVLAPASG